MIMFPGPVDALYVVLETNLGSMSVELFWKYSPKTCQNFATLAARYRVLGTMKNHTPDSKSQTANCKLQNHREADTTREGSINPRIHKLTHPSSDVSIN
jgi:cyclophilin family peptidyl-prolyl cis-trans isomerase